MPAPMWKEVTPRSRKYLDWIRTQPCVCCGAAAEPHHENEEGHGAKGLKCSDYRAISLCHTCHMHRHWRGRSFYQAYGVDPEKEIKRLNQKWERRSK